jgi:hypothetical protein
VRINKLIVICAAPSCSCQRASAVDDGQKLIAGDKALLFLGMHQFGEKFDLTQQLAEGPVVLIFLP